MKRETRQTSIGLLVAAAIGAAALLAGAPARAERRPPFGNDAGMLESRVREDIERRVTPVLEQMAPGQADLTYVDVRVNRPTALATGANPGFEDLGPGADYVAERVELTVQLDSKLPPAFRKDLKELIKGKLESLAVPIDIKERVFAYPTPRPQPPAPREPMPYYPPAPAAAAPPPPAPAAAPAPPAPPNLPRSMEAPAGWPGWAVALLLATVVLLLVCLALLAVILAERRRGRAAADGSSGRDAADPNAAAPGARANPPLPGPDRLPEVRRALSEDRLLARRVLGEMLEQNELDKVARTVELVGPTVVDDLRSDPAYAQGLREAAARLDASKAASADEIRALCDELYRRVLKHRMMGSGDPVEQEFAFLVGLPAARFAAILHGERAGARAAALRYAPAHLRAAYLGDCDLEERAALVVALADAKNLKKEYLMDVAATLRARAIDHAHVGGGEASEIELLVEMVEDAAAEERARLLDAMGAADPDKRRRVQALLVTDQALTQIADSVLGSATLSVPQEVLAIFLRATSLPVRERVLAALPGAVAGGLREELALEVPLASEAAVEARRAVHRALRRALRERGLPIPSVVGEGRPGEIADGSAAGGAGGSAGGNGRKVVAL
jgi:flagellar motor switch protein FliG